MTFAALAPGPSALNAAATGLPSGWEWAGLLLAYLLGAVPFGLVIIRAFRGVDLRQQGSGNIGATNAIRAGGKPLGLVVFLLDIAKGIVPVALFAPLFAGWGPHGPETLPALQVQCGAAAVIGHCFPIYLRFKGGKGVATGCGVLIALDWPVFVVGGLAWLAVMALTRYTGLASMVMGASFPVAAWLRTTPGQRELFAGSLLLALLIAVRHRPNIQRMLSGTEPKAGRK
jgi:glycerol-3-phosphate acyltransferase PlsY